MVRKKILVVDDDRTTRHLIRGILQSPGLDFEIIEAANGTECLMVLEDQGPFDLILLDVVMPDIDGYAICRAIRHIDPVVPIVFVTSRGDLTDRTTGRRAGGDSYLVKPVRPAPLLSIVNLLTSTDRRRFGPSPTPRRVRPTAD